MLRNQICLASLTLAATSFLAATAQAQQQKTFADPANLAGERVSPRTGRELPIDQGSRGLQQLLRKLNTRASLMNIVAHPDDEDGGMLTLYSRGLGARVADISLTRGEGGQNAMTGDFEDALGLLRTQELLSNDRFVGVDQLFGTEVDFGFSKTKSEAFTKWTHDRVLYDVVRAIRIYRPLVLTSTWIGAATDGHGQHQVAGQITQEAFLAAGDPNVFPELTAEGILPWQPLKVYARVPMSSISPRGLYDYATGQYVPAEFPNYVTHTISTTPPSPDVTVHEGKPDPILSAPNEGPVTYIQFARRGLSEQKSQMGPGGRIAPVGDFDVHYHLYGTRNDGSSPTAAATTGNEPSFFDGIDTSITSIASLAPSDPKLLADPLRQIQQLLAEASSHYDPEHPETIAPTLANALSSLRTLSHSVSASSLPESEKTLVLRELDVKEVQANDALAFSLGLSLNAQIEQFEQPNEPYTLPAVTTSPEVSIGSDIHIVSSVKTGPMPVTIRSSEIESPGTLSDIDYGGIPLIANSEHLFQNTIHLQNNPAHVTRPYFKRSSIEQPIYDLADTAFRNAPLTPGSPMLRYIVDYNGVSIYLSATIRAGDETLRVIPPVSLALPNRAQVLPRTAQHLDLTLSTRTLDTATLGAAATLELPTRWEADRSLALLNQPSTNFHLTFPLGSLTHTESITARANISGQSITEGFRPIGYGSLPRTNLYTPATTRIVPVDLNLPTHAHIAYLPGTGDSVPEALAAIGLPVTTLTVDDLNLNKLAIYDTVILGVRTYAAHPDLHGAPTQALLDYARNGGNVVLQYQSSEFSAADAPYPLDLGSEEKVVDETAPVTLLAPKSSLFNTPNKITSADFNNWIEERGHGFLSTWDPRYTALTETHDPGAPAEHVAPQAPQRGGLLTVQLGKGRWTYCAFALYRQLPEAVPGAYRLLTNLLNP